MGIPAFIVTLAGMLLFRGLDLMILNAESIVVPEAFQKIANGYLPERGPNTGYHNLTLLLTLLGVGIVVWLELQKPGRPEEARHDAAIDGRARSLKLVLLGGDHHRRRPAAGLLQGHPGGRA